MADAAGRGVRRCPRCGAEGYVIDSRLNAAGEIRRRRRCPECDRRWSTVEIRKEPDRQPHIR